KDILDVWFDSGVSHQAVAKVRLNDQLPVDLYLEGSDQHRGWFQSSLIPAIAIEGKPPFKAVLTHGFVVDGEGRKMSKSLGNVVSPQDIIKNSGADILRLWVASSLYNEDIRISKEGLARLSDAYRKIRNTVRYLLGNLNGFDPDKHSVPYEGLWAIDQWALCRLKEVMDQAKRSFDAYEFAWVYKYIYSFCNEDLSSFYLDILKDRLYTSAANSQERRSAQTVLYHILNHLVRVIAPIFSFTAEEIFLAMPKDSSMAAMESVHLLPWIGCPDLWSNDKIKEKFALLTALRPHVLRALEDKRRAGGIGSSLEAKILFRTASPKDLAYLTDNAAMLPSAFIVSQVTTENVNEISQGLSEEFPQTEIVIEKADGQKCGRCWNYREDVGQETQHPALCQRCASIVKEFV
ncbi:MAG TPA: class I tRNA ligase family protein, partial [Candidatus Omnitrophota bacterium]|nr:class I tRNA ligase family protein [Candidatus Omnitrophota bacterium]